MGADETRVPEAVRRLFDGHDLAAKAGTAVLLVTVDPDGWPRSALLSVGEVLMTDDRGIRVTLHAASRTAASLTSSRLALLHLVHGGEVARIRIRFERGRTILDGAQVLFAGTVDSVDVDAVGYARIVAGITYELLDPNPILERWAAQVEELRDDHALAQGNQSRQ